MSYANPPLSPGGGPGGVPSKRDKRRTALQERLQELTGQFSNNRDIQFRQQLHALQCDMTLINNADPYTMGPLPDSAESIAALIEETVGGGSKFAKEMAGLAGTWYSRFVQQINEIKENRDAELVSTMVSLVILARTMSMELFLISGIFPHAEPLQQYHGTKPARP
jgi:hypothetical protein